MANLKITQLDEAGPIEDTDLVEIVQDVGNTNVNVKGPWSLIKSTLKTFFDTLYEGALGFTPENVANKTTDIVSDGASDTKYPSAKTIKDYVDNSVGLAIDYFFNNTTSDIGGIYDDMTNEDLGGVEADIETTGLTANTNDQPLNNFATLDGEPNILSIPKGILDVHFHATRTGGSSDVNIYAIIYKRASGGTETLIATTEISNAITTKAPFTLHASIAVDIDLLETDRIVVKFFANLGAGSGATIQIHVEGTTTSHLTLPTSTEILSNIFLRRDANDFSIFDEKVSPHDDDLILIEDSEASGVKKKVKKSALAGNGVGGAIVKTMIPQPLPPNQFAATLNQTMNDNTIGFVGLFSFLFGITINKISFRTGTLITQSGTLDLTLYSEDGQTQYFSITTPTISSVNTLYTIDVSALELPAGNYYLLVNTNSTTNLRVWIYNLQGEPFSLNEGLPYDVSGKAKYGGTLVISAGIPPATIDPTAITEANGLLCIRVDN